MGYYGAPGAAAFDITVYSNSAGEPWNIGPAKCLTQTVAGSPTGSPIAQQTAIPLATPCTVAPGAYWLEVQEVDPNDPWYWQTQGTDRSSYDADWRENGAFGTPCAPGYVDG